MKRSESIKKLREFGLLIGLTFPIFFGLILPAISGHDLKAWTLFVGIPSLLIGVLKPNLLFYPYQYWMLLGNYLGWINSRIILTQELYDY